MNYHGSISAYHNFLAFQESPKLFVFVEVISVDHEDRTLEIAERTVICLPARALKLVLFKEKVFMILETGVVGRRDFASDSAKYVRIFLPNEVDHFNMFRINEFIFVKGESRLNIELLQDNVWAVMNGNESIESLTVRRPPVLSLIQAAFGSRFPGQRVSDVRWLGSWCNAIIVQCVVSNVDLLVDNPEVGRETEVWVISARLLREPDPSMEDFTCAQRFVDIVDTNNFQAVRYDGLLSQPFDLPKRRDPATSNSSKIVQLLGMTLRTIELEENQFPENVCQAYEHEDAFSNSDTEDSPSEPHPPPPVVEAIENAENLPNLGLQPQPHPPPPPRLVRSPVWTLVTLRNSYDAV